MNIWEHVGKKLIFPLYLYADVHINDISDYVVMSLV